jgi:hypothetical protein
MQCLGTKGSNMSTYLITSFHSPFGINGHKFTYQLHLVTSYFINITCISSLLIWISVDTNSLINCISSLLILLPLCHQWTKRLLIIILLNSIGNLWVLFAWDQFPPSPIDSREFYPCPTYFSMILDLSMMIKKYNNMEWYIWHIDMS